MGRIAFNLFAQPIDMDGDGCRTAHGIQLPDAVIQHLLAEYDLRMLCEKEQEVKLACRKDHLVPPKKYAPRLRLNLKRVKTQDGRLPRTSFEALLAREMCLDACLSSLGLNGLMI